MSYTRTHDDKRQHDIYYLQCFARTKETDALTLRKKRDIKSILVMTGKRNFCRQILFFFLPSTAVPSYKMEDFVAVALRSVIGL